MSILHSNVKIQFSGAWSLMDKITQIQFTIICENLQA